MRMNGLVGNLKNVIFNRYYLYEDFEGYIEKRPFSGNIIIDNEDDKLLIATRVRPKWEYPDGNITLINNYAKINKGLGSNRRLYTKTIKNIGEWYFKLKVYENITSNTILLAFIYQGGNDYLGIIISGNRYIKIIKRIGGVSSDILNPNFQLDINNYQLIKVTRNEGGELELFIDGESKGIAQDNTEPTTNYFHINNTSNSDIYIKYIKII